MPVKRTLLDTAQPIPVDPLAQLVAKRRQLRADLVDATAGDEAFRRELLDLLKTLGAGKCGRASARSRLAYVKALHEAGFTKLEIIEVIERLYSVSERQIERDLKSLRHK